MNTRFITEVSARFNPFQARSKIVRVFLANLPPNARQTMKIKTTVLPRASCEGSKLLLKFKDGKEMELDTEKLKVNDVIEEVNRHARMLSRTEELSGS
ncbi:MAG: 39S ribosomal protein L44, mitochondrial [Trizodia sp. TS-e1964]|nr:MAG: 39S ribosomal protein L44, mitochondrial [Trizodia sp. TS-e1964]